MKIKNNRSKVKLFNIQWLLSVVSKYMFTKRSSFWIILISIVGIVFGLAILVVILSIMNGSQMIYYENSQELLSYHIRVDCDSSYEESFRKADSFRTDISNIASVNLFFETQGILANSRGKQIFLMVRGVEPNIMELDSRMSSFLTMRSGVFNLYDDNSIVLGSEMARALSVSTGSTLSFHSLIGGANSSKDIDKSFTVTGVYETDWGLGVDSLLAFIPISLYNQIAQGSDYKIGLKLLNSNQDHKVISQIKKMDLPLNWSVQSWREYNSSFFGALRMEKSVMMLLVLLIFFVFAVNTYNGLNRLIYDKQEELAVLRTMGASPSDIRSIFILQGIIIAVIGCFFGTMIGLFIVVNLEEIRMITTSIKDEFLYQFYPQSAYNYNWAQESLNEPRIMLKDLLLINFMAVFITLASAFLASAKIGKIKPAEVLRYE